MLQTKTQQPEPCTHILSRGGTTLRPSGKLELIVSEPIERADGRQQRQRSRNIGNEDGPKRKKREDFGGKI